VGGRAEAIEFHVGNGFEGNGIPLKTLKLKKDILIAIIIRGGRIVYPTGEDAIQPDDSIVVVTTRSGINEISDILQ
jgi:trk system potassium uptake protein TrkA